MSHDLVNGLFEFVGSLFTWANVRAVWLAKGYSGYYLPGMVFFTSWGLWNLFYYPALGQWWSTFGGACITLANLCWIGSMWWFGRKV